MAFTGACFLLLLGNFATPACLVWFLLSILLLATAYLDYLRQLTVLHATAGVGVVPTRAAPGGLGRPEQEGSLRACFEVHHLGAGLVPVPNLAFTPALLALTHPVAVALGRAFEAARVAAAAAAAGEDARG